MYLIDTNIISELRKGHKTNAGVQKFFEKVIQGNLPIYTSAITIGELRRGVDLIYHRGDETQGKLLENRLDTLLYHYQDKILAIDSEIALIWGKLRVPQPDHALDKMIAATGIIYDLTVVTRNTKDFSNTGVRVLNPFTE